MASWSLSYFKAQRILNFYPSHRGGPRLGKPISQVTPPVRVCNWIGKSLFKPGSREFVADTDSFFIAALKLIISWPLLCLLLSYLHVMLQVCWSENYGVISNMTKQHKLRLLPPNLDTGRCNQPTDQNGIRTHETSFQRTTEHTATNSTSQRPQDNARLDQGGSSSGTSPPDGELGDDTALLRPSYLCFLKQSPDGTDDYETVNVSDYLRKNGDGVDVEYVFVSYTRVHFRVSTDEEIAKYDYPEPREKTREANRQVAKRYRVALIKVGTDAARKVGKQAFRLDFECVRDNVVAKSTSSSEDVYKIYDYVRVAHSMIIAIGPTANDKVKALMNGEDLDSLPYNPDMVTPWLRQSGSRLWTLPELLLCPGEYRIRLYVVGDSSEPQAIAKRNFAERAWTDAWAVKQLVDHFEGSAILTSSALIETAMTCFSTRQIDQFSQGDIAYATRGLFPSRQRPDVDKRDTGLQAFGKLALENDSATFLSRLICLSIPQGSPWCRLEDRWGVELRDIRPIGNLRDVLEPEAVSLEGVFGTTIHWDNMDAEPYFGQGIGRFEKVIYHGPYITTSILLYFFVILLFQESKLFLIYPALIGLFALLLPLGIINSRRHLRRPTIPRLIGIEGEVHVEKIEKYLWGFNYGNLKRDTTGSYTDSPANNPRVTNSLTAPQVTTFTLVDTYAMSVTHLECSTPPVAMFVCGEENGMHRAIILCSYDWRTRSYHRQFVLRSKRWKLENMRLVDRVCVSLAPHTNTQRSAEDLHSGPSISLTTPSLSANSNRVASIERPSRMRRELLFFGDVPFWVEPFLSREIISSKRRPKLPLHQVFPYVVFVKAYLAFPVSLYERNSYIWSIFGILDGWEVSMLLSLLPEWFSPRELPLRFLLCLTVVPKLQTMIGYFGVPPMMYFSGSIVLMQFLLQWILLFKAHSGLVGRPREVSWLETYQKVVLFHDADIRKFLSDTRGYLRHHRKSSFYYARTLFLVFAFSFLNSFIPMPLEKLPWDLYRTVSMDALLAILTGLAIFYRPSSALLLYIAVSKSTGTFSIQVAALISISYAGTSMGTVLLSTITEKYMYLWDFTVNVYLPLIVTETVIWFLYWKYKWAHGQTEDLHEESAPRDVESHVPQEGELLTT
ncbi:hypothetical protein BDP81DRAFT_493459 [Colletotrichum phormii]|uniref:Uncharacterized protein n=1 Tax=Colletotrichum phormii TaxID=359342 RepID=A0AAI9ZLL5_9PEZI|nr:uncharacterized protein BDP81DRAFT_493459 [Colletotrichum phormii]KAK1634231.1 hypothetical protein BDP81DRAFT_493459 [Colletotrichum phormii]